MAHSYDYGDNSHGPHLYVEYTTSGGPTPTPTNTPVGPTATYTPTPTGSASGTVDVRVGSSSDDAEEYGSSVDLTSSDLEMVDDDSQSRLDQTVGLRFTNITIPQGATITTAYIEFEVDEYDSDTTSLTIQGQAADNPSTFTTSSGDITGRTTTTASVSWNNIPTWSTAGDLEQTPSLTTIVQEMVNRSGWQSGNAMAFLIEGSGKRVARSYDYSSGDAPRLYIEYTTSGGPTPTPTNTPTGPTPTPTTTPTGSSCTVTLTPVADAFVRSGSYASTNYGSDTQLVVKAGGTNYKRETHFKFDLSSLGISSITDADLEVDVTYVKNGGPVPVTVYASGSDSWTEGGITWNNRPSLGTSQTTVSISSTGIASFDVTSLTSTEAAGDETLSLILWDNNSTDLEVEMRSKEDGTNAPELVVSGWCSSASAGNQQLASVDSGLQILWRNTISEFRDYMTVAQALTSQEVSVIGPQPKPQSRSKVASQTTVTQSTVRKTYLLAGQAIAQKTVVTVGSNPSTSELYFIYTDHLGSANVLATADGNNTPVQVARFMPFGEYRTEPTADITDRGFTGHRENREIGLTYMNARFYISSIGRFASADTIVPDPASPQSYNRYAYTLNNPLKYTDPSGHDPAPLCQAVPESCYPTRRPAISDDPMIVFNSCDTCTWSAEEMAAIEESATVTGTRLAETLNRIYPTWHLTAQEAFLYTYGGSVSFRKTGTACAQGCWGETFLRDNGLHEIEVYTNADLTDRNTDKWGVHELGHAFANSVIGRATPVRDLKLYQSLGFPDRPPGSPKDSTWGFYGGRWTWQRSDQGAASEEFADMYLGWVYNKWEGGDNLTIDGQMRQSFMNLHMPYYLKK